jgi:hypothetical protein
LPLLLLLLPVPLPPLRTEARIMIVSSWPVPVVQAVVQAVAHVRGYLVLYQSSIGGCGQ